jgi:hypothetical protein
MMRKTLRRRALALLWIGMRTKFHDAAPGLNRSSEVAQSFPRGFDMSKPHSNLGSQPAAETEMQIEAFGVRFCKRVTATARTLDGLASHDGQQGLRGRASNPLAILDLRPQPKCA